MSGLLKTIVALGAAAMMTLSPVLGKDLGVYQTPERHMDFQLFTCGSGEELCVTLTGARGDAATEKIVPFIGKVILDQAKLVGENTWQGRIRYGDYDLYGTVSLKPGQSLIVQGCVFLILCDGITLIPAN